MDNPLVIVFVVSIVLIAIYMAIEGFVLAYNVGSRVWSKTGKDDKDVPPPVSVPTPPVVAQTPQAAPQIDMPSFEWLSLINDHPDKYPVLFIYGPQGTGKTTILRAILHHRGGKVVLFAVKPDDAWEFDHYSIGDDGTFDETRQAMVAMLQHVKQRIADHRQGVKHDPVTVVIDDAMALRMNTQAEYDEMVKFIATVGRSYRVRLIVIMHSDRGVVAGFKGQADMLDGFIKLQLSINERTEQRSAVLRRQTSEGEASRNLDTSDVHELSRQPLTGMAFDLQAAPAPATRWTDKHEQASAILTDEPNISGRKLALALYGHETGESFNLAKKIRDEVEGRRQIEK